MSIPKTEFQIRNHYICKKYEYVVYELWYIALFRLLRSLYLIITLITLDVSDICHLISNYVDFVP